MVKVPDVEFSHWHTESLCFCSTELLTLSAVFIFIASLFLLMEGKFRQSDHTTQICRRTCSDFTKFWAISGTWATKHF